MKEEHRITKAEIANLVDHSYAKVEQRSPNLLIT